MDPEPCRKSFRHAATPAPSSREPRAPFSAEKKNGGDWLRPADQRFGTKCTTTPESKPAPALVSSKSQQMEISSRLFQVAVGWARLVIARGQQGSGRSAAAEAAAENGTSIAAVNRCATQNRNQSQGQRTGVSAPHEQNQSQRQADKSAHNQIVNLRHPPPKRNPASTFTLSEKRTGRRWRGDY